MVNGKKICELRNAAGMTQEELGDRAGVSYAQISQIERGIREPGIKTLKLIADTFGTSVDGLLSPPQGSRG